MGVDPTVSGLVDGTDFPHSALFHALNIATQGSYAIIDRNDFDITQSDSGGKTRFAVAAGKVVRDGVLQAAVSTANFTQGTPSSFEEPTSGFSYYLLVVNSSNALALKDNGGTILNDIVPNPASTDIPIAVLRLGAGETTTQRHVQFLTTTKNSNSLSIARNNSGYTESATIKSNAGDIEFEALEQDKDIIFKGNDGGSSTTIATIDVSDKKLIVPSRIETNLLQLGYGTGNGKVQVYNAGDNLELYAAGDSGGNVKVIDLDAGTDGAEANRIATISGHLHVSKKTGVGTSSPMNTLQVSHTGADGDNGLMIVREDTTTADTDLLGGIGFDSTDGNVPSSVLEASAYIAALAAEDHGTGDKGADLTFGTAAIDENDDTVSTEHMRILSDGKVGLGNAAPEHRLDIVETTDNFPFRLRGAEGNIRINKYGHVQIQNENASDSSTIDDPIWQIGQRDGGQLDIAFGNISTQLVAGSDAIISLARASNSASGNKQIGFFGATAVNQQTAAPACPTGGAANADLNAQSINLLITALTNLGLIA
jgi:hypothetical protein